MPFHMSPRAMKKILHYLTQTEALRCQQLNRWMYERGAARGQPRFEVVQEPRARLTRVNQLQPRVITHNAAQKVWVVTDFLEETEDNFTGLRVKPMLQILDHLGATPDRLAYVRTPMNSAG